jgi:uncharacterized protein (DUF2141 family)
MKPVLITACFALAAATSLMTAHSVAWAQTAPEAPAGRAALTVTFEQIETVSGQILFSVYDSEAAHDAGGKPVRVAMARVEGPTASVRIEGLTPGLYAIKAFHDVDGDGQMKTNPFGMPLEPFAFSNNARPVGGPAPWQATSFAVPAGESETRIVIQ